MHGCGIRYKKLFWKSDIFIFITVSKTSSIGGMTHLVCVPVTGSCVIVTFGTDLEVLFEPPTVTT